MDSLVRSSIHGLPDVPGQDCPFEKNKRIDLGTAHGASLKIWPAAALVAGDENTTDALNGPQVCVVVLLISHGDLDSGDAP